MKFNQLLAKFDEFPWFATIFVFILKNYRVRGVLGGIVGSVLEINKKLRANFSEKERRLVLMGIPVLGFITAGLLYLFYPVSFVMNQESIELIQQFFTN